MMKPLNLKSFFRKQKYSLIGMGLGAIAGYFYWQQIGCESGTCMISSKPLNSTLYFALMGYLVANLFTPKTPTNKQAADIDQQQ